MYLTSVWQIQYSPKCECSFIWQHKHILGECHFLSQSYCILLTAFNAKVNVKGGKQFLATNMIGMKKQINLKTKTNGCFRIQTMLLFLVGKVPVVCIFFNAVRVSYVIPSFYCYHSIVCMHDRFLHIHLLYYVIIKSCTNWCTVGLTNLSIFIQEKIFLASGSFMRWFLESVCLFFREEDELSQSSRHSNMSNSGGSANGSSSFFHGSESVQAGRYIVIDCPPTM